MDRYVRHFPLREFGGSYGQGRICLSSVLVVGAGGLGSPVSLYLADAGVGTIGIIDGDTVDLSNLNRQIAHDEKGCGVINKAISAANACKRHDFKWSTPKSVSV
eukprot:TRINITY_DN1198_c0_g1_i1.p1 TRINITY_DN1198_c0_g1~~TRINITY_DN1198_c0_g1_i1.p1  ORF type:complete len:104 (-),score=28.57 TRINITY_DN1198_c0_g1_i1:379-690(-)